MMFLILSQFSIEGGEVIFFLEDKGYKEVMIAGSFTGWEKKPCMKEGNLWKARFKLLPGVHVYKYILDGEWKEDPKNPLKIPDGYGGYNSAFVLTEKGEIITEPFLAYRDGRVWFRFYDPHASTVYLAGNFNNWDPTSIPMIKKDGLFEVSLELGPGTYYYKFVINGERWVEDPLNPGQVPDGFGGKNSVFTLRENGEIVFAEVSPFPSGVRASERLKWEGEPLYLAILWHQHQPYYLKKEPWVRLHAIKDYYDMAEMADEFSVKFTVNLTPSLIRQILELIEDMKNGKYGDEYLYYTMKPASELTPDERHFIIEHFFSANWKNMIGVFPRYRELLDKKQNGKKFTEQDIRDLQVLFNLAWFDPDFREKEIILPTGKRVCLRELVEKERNYTEEDKKIIWDAQLAILEAILPLHKKLQDEGKIEVSTTPFYHPILPLIYNTDVAKECMPGTPLPTRFSYPQDAEEHVRRACELYRQIFGRDVRGMWPGEGSVSEDVIPLFKKYGVRWIATDEGILQRSGGGPHTKPYDFSGLTIVFRDRTLSDLIGFRYNSMDPLDAANDFILRLYGIRKRFPGKILVAVILDGENAWEHFPHDGKDFLREFYREIAEAPWIVPVTMSEGIELVEHGKLERLHPGSWINSDFHIWIGEKEENTAWEYLKHVRKDYDKYGDENPEAYEWILVAEGSDWFWWYGMDQETFNEGFFDWAFREALKNVYRSMGKEPPSFLDVPIMERR